MNMRLTYNTIMYFFIVLTLLTNQGPIVQGVQSTQAAVLRAPAAALLMNQRAY